jgi:[ribosomal protein S5]-alanine N-acetyltransferase
MALLIETERLRLRHFTEEDAPLLRALNENPNVYRYTGDGPLADDAAALDVLRTRIFPQAREHRVGRWAVELRRDDGPVFIGWCGLKWDGETATFDLGYRFFEEHWGRGYATEAATATLAWARVHLPDARIVARARVENTASIYVLEKVGLRAIGEERDEDGEVVVFHL